jgi:hypothetical protein
MKKSAMNTMMAITAIVMRNQLKNSMFLLEIICVVLVKRPKITKKIQTVCAFGLDYLFNIM